MSESKHTPGPWRYQEGADAYTHIVRAGENHFLCQLAQDTSGKAEANARLIAACPDLLEALTDLLSQIEQHPGGYDYRPFYRLKARSQLNDLDAKVIRARAAIAKATGALEGAKDV